MALLRNAARLAAMPLARPVSNLRLPVAPRAALGAVRSYVSRSAPRLGHNLEDHYDMAEFMCKMHHPLGEYLIWAMIFSTVLVTFGPLVHSNYYFTGRFLPKDQGNTQLCDDSW
mmetsp:Transcript_2666/g.5452  ORF Transcript_2666/g.5452 Transcript_2666/m.5452 type:complete len:114 (+) Transcript_2666:59-400(+)